MAAASDADWLRSRTSRLLGLTDDDDALVSSYLPQDEDRRTKADHNVDQTFNLKLVSDSISQTGGKHGAEATHEKQEPVQISEGATETGRLFVRNLLYTTKETDLRAYFAQFGDLEEVS